MRIALRVDGSDRIGTGHVVRCLTLADRLAEAGHACHFVMRDHLGAPTGLIETRGFPLTLLPRVDGSDTGGLAHSHWLGTSQDRDAMDMLAALKEPVDWLVVDHYALDQQWHRALRPSARHILVIDDIADRIHDCDLLLDQNLQGAAGRYDGLVPPACHVMLGPQYALLKPRFASLRDDRTATEGDGAILLYFGGIDAEGATLTALEAVAGAELRHRPIDVVVGDRNPHRAAVADWCAAHSNARFHGGGSDMAALMANAALAVGAAGATAWERCCLGLPTILVTLAENQKPGAAALAREGAAIWLGDFPEVSAETLAAALRTLDAAPHLADVIGRRAAALVDGRGTDRVVRAMDREPIVLRRAGPDDCDAVWTWRNDERTRRHSLDPAPVPLDDHRRWFSSSLANTDRALLIGESAGEPVGVLRYDRVADSATISVYLVPGREGRGEGARLIRAGSDWLVRNWPDVRAIDAEILEANQASSRAFAAAGFIAHLSLYRRSLP
jgi:UDP-2,4-diacetamido-2,4,6-trideoxy-beta-L-altropyranose hydrolase